MRASLIPCITALCLALPSAEASGQAARSAAQRSAPPPPAAEMLRHVPADMTAIMVGDVQALIDAFGQSLGLGFDAEPMLRAALATITNQSDWTEHGVRLDQMRRGLIAFHEPTDRAVVIVDAAAIDVPSLRPAQPYRLGHDAMLHQLDTFYGITTEDGPWHDSSAAFDIAVAWPEAAPFAETAIWWAYLSEPELFRELDREFEYQLSAAGASRGFIALAPDSSLVVLVNTDVAGAERFFGRVQAATAAWESDSPSEVLERLHFEAALSRLSFEDLGSGTVAIHVAAPSCGGLTQQAAAIGVVGLAWIIEEESGRAVDGAWAPRQDLIADSCDTEPIAPSLAWEALRLVPDETAALGVIVDLHAAYSQLGRTLGGFAPYVLDQDAFQEALDGSDLSALLEPGGLNAFVVSDAHDSNFAFGGVASDALAALVNIQTTPVAGIGNVFGDIQATLPETAELPQQWQSLRDAAPAGSVGVVLLNAALAQELVNEAPSMFHGAFSNAVQESSGLVFALADDGRYSMRIHGIPPSAANVVRENLTALAADLADASGFMFPQFIIFGAQFFADAIEVDSFETGVEVRLIANPSPLFMAGTFFMLGRVETFPNQQPTSTPASRNPTHSQFRH